MCKTMADRIKRKIASMYGGACDIGLNNVEICVRRTIAFNIDQFKKEKGVLR